MTPAPNPNPSSRSKPASRRARQAAYLLAFLLLAAVLSPIASTLAAGRPESPPAQNDNPRNQAIALLSRMSPEERIGQLFLVTFTGTLVDESSQIYDLIANHHIGGVILMAGNDNFPGGEGATAALLEMNRQLQLNRWNAAQAQRIDPATGEPYRVNFVPLFIGISQEGDGSPNDQILNGLTPLPNEMAIGAAWDPDLTRQVGRVLGSELSALGFNLLLGPSLDVLEQPRPEDPSDLGTRTFGGDPFWVGVMGQAYIEGLHVGSNGRMAVIAKHFPGNGGADRLPEEEVATVRKSFEQLKNFDLKPFFAVTGNAINGSPVSSEAAADGLLASHIRYQGFQENIRATTRPVSFDKSAFDLLMGLAELSTWRDQGGVMVSDSLGSQAVRRFYEVSGQDYDARRVAQNAFQAGNDLLYLGDISSGDEIDSYTATVNVLTYFAQKYQTDLTFAQDVDESVLRILTLKNRLYPNQSSGGVLPNEEGLAQLGQASQVSFEVARRAATLISPPLAELDETIPDPPNLNDRLVFITDARDARQCKLCPVQPALAVDALEAEVERLYGPQGGAQVLPGNLDSFTYEDLVAMLDSPRNTTQIESDLRRANWVVFATLNEPADLPPTRALQRFLSERPDLFQRKRLVVFAFNAPYYLDATNISKITAFFGLYSKSPSFIETAARLLFRELTPQGALPVSVPGIGYDLIAATSPNPNQVIPLYFETSPVTVTQETTTPEPAVIPEYTLGEAIPLRTGVILDHNGHTVPDGTPVQFIQTINGETSVLPQTETRGGVASITIQVTSSGTWEIQAESEPAKSEALRFDVPSETGEIVTITPTLAPTLTPTPTETPTLAPTITLAPVLPQEAGPALTDWFMAVVLTTIIGLSAYRVAAQMGQVRWGVRAGFLALIGGLLAYSYLAMDLPGSEKLLEDVGAWGIVLATLLGCLLGLGSAWAWRTLSPAGHQDMEKEHS